MKETGTMCNRFRDGKICCIHCGHTSVKNGFSKNIQRYKCSVCKRTFQDEYLYLAYDKRLNSVIGDMVKEGCGIRSIGRLLKISSTTVLKRILTIAGNITRPPISTNKVYEVDELCTYVQKKLNQTWIVIALQKDNKEVVDFTVGCRTSKTLNSIISTLLLSKAEKIYTDKLSAYQTLIPVALHSTNYRGTNHIERKNLTLGNVPDMLIY